MPQNPDFWNVMVQDVIHRRLRHKGSLDSLLCIGLHAHVVLKCMLYMTWQCRLGGLALLHIYHNIPVDDPAVLPPMKTRDGQYFVMSCMISDLYSTLLQQSDDTCVMCP